MQVEVEVEDSQVHKREDFQVQKRDDSQVHKRVPCRGYELLQGPTTGDDHFRPAKKQLPCFEYEITHL